MGKRRGHTRVDALASALQAILRKTGALADPPVEVWPFADARQALQAVEHRRSLGKNVLSRRA